MRRRAVLQFLALGGAAAVLAACSQRLSSTATAPDTQPALTIIPTNPAPGSEASIAVAVASSLQSVMDAFAQVYHTQTNLPLPQLQAASSTALVQQIIGGAAFDVLCAADQAAYKPLIEAGSVNAKEIHPIAKTSVVIVARPDTALKNFTDVTASGLKIVAADEKVPLGRYTTILLNAIGKRSRERGFAKNVSANIVSYEESATAVTQKFFTGEVDVAIVYASDLAQHPAESYRIIELPAGVDIQSTYFAALLPNAKTGSMEFMNLLLDRAQAGVWSAHGFTPINS